MVKKNSAAQKRVGKLLKKSLNKVEMHRDLSIENIKKKEQVEQKARNQQLAKSLGSKQQVNLHLEAYSAELKSLIAKLNDESIEAANKKPTTTLKIKKEGADQDVTGFDSGDDGSQKEADEKIKEFLHSSGPSNERKEKLKIRLINESQTYYQNNLNIFSNGLSLLSVNSLEIHGMLHQVGGQTGEMVKLVNNVEAHSTFMRDKTGDMVKKLK